MIVTACAHQVGFNTPAANSGRFPTPSKKQLSSVLSRSFKFLLNPFFRVAFLTPEDFVFDHRGESYGYAYRALPFL